MPTSSWLVAEFGFLIIGGVGELGAPPHFHSASAAPLCCWRRRCQIAKTAIDLLNSHDCRCSCSGLRTWVHWIFAKKTHMTSLLHRVSFFQTGSSYISAVDWVILTKFGLLIDFGLYKTATSPSPKVKLRHRGCHLAKR